MTFPCRRMVEELREEILSGSRPPGSRLPSENELAAAYATSRPTVRRALAVLKGEGLMDTEQGRGAFVRERPTWEMDRERIHAIAAELSRPHDFGERVELTEELLAIYDRVRYEAARGLD